MHIICLFIIYLFLSLCASEIFIVKLNVGITCSFASPYIPLGSSIVEGIFVGCCVPCRPNTVSLRGLALFSSLPFRSIQTNLFLTLFAPSSVSLFTCSHVTETVSRPLEWGMGGHISLLTSSSLTFVKRPSKLEV